jgi:hypothetical protein
MKKLKTFVLASALFSLCSCSAFEAVDAMRTNTDDMGRDTNKMSEQMTLTQQQMTDMSSSMDTMNSGMNNMSNKLGSMSDSIASMSGKMDNMSSSMDKMYSDLRMGDALNARLKSLNDMNDTKLLAAKTAHASHFFISFEYQLWKGQGTDNAQTRLGLMDDAVREFATMAQKYILNDARSISVAAEGNEMLNLFALALCMHMQNPASQRVLGEQNIPLVNMFDLVRDGLQAGADLRSGKREMSDIRPYEASVLEYEDVFEYLFELRANMFPGMVIGNLSNADATNFANKWWTRANLFMMPWKAQTSEKNVVQLRMYNTWVREALTIKEFFKNTDRKLRLDNLMIRILKNLRIPELKALVKDSSFRESDSERVIELKKLSAEVSLFLKN